MCTLKLPLRTNFFWQMWQVSQVPSLCDFSRCRFSWTNHIKRSEQCLHECGFAPVWTRAWSCTSWVVLNIFPQWWHWYSLLLLCIRRLCICKWQDWLKLLLHSEHLYGFSPVWTLMWLFRLPDSLNALSQMWQLYGFSPLWILLWQIRLHDVVNRLLQTVHSNAFCPEWLRLCTARSLLLPRHTPHSVHLYLPVWIFLWRLRPLRDEKHFSHWLQEYKCFPVCLLLWTVKFCFVVNRLSQTVQRYCFSPSFVLLRSFKLLLVWIFGLGLSSCSYSVVSLLSSSIFTSNVFPVQVKITDKH